MAVPIPLETPARGQGYRRSELGAGQPESQVSAAYFITTCSLQVCFFRPRMRLSGCTLAECVKCSFNPSCLENWNFQMSQIELEA